MIRVSRIKEDADYEDVRVQFHATLARARIPMRLDIGFGDVITPGPTELEDPTTLDFALQYFSLPEGDRRGREVEGAYDFWAPDHQGKIFTFHGVLIVADHHAILESATIRTIGYY